jgi:5-formyltetrahydrofolate cyclo-ligase
MDKTQLRRQLQKRLLELTTEQRAEKSKKACQNLISTLQFRTASTVMLYLSLPHEVDTSEAILHAWQMGKTVAVPKVSWQQRHMIPVQIHSLETGFSTGVSGLRNPVTGVPTPIADIDLVVAPALGYDRKGNRLGRGGSFYDRFFVHKDLKAVKCGFAFAEQQIDSIPTVDHDKPIDLLVTDEEVIYFNNSHKGCLEQGG